MCHLHAGEYNTAEQEWIRCGWVGAEKTFICRQFTYEVRSLMRKTRSLWRFTNWRGHTHDARRSSTGLSLAHSAPSFGAGRQRQRCPSYFLKIHKPLVHTNKIRLSQQVFTPIRCNQTHPRSAARGSPQSSQAV